MLRRGLGRSLGRGGNPATGQTGHSLKPSGSPPANQKRGGELRRRAARVPNLIGIQGTFLAIKGQIYRDLRTESQP